MAHPKLFWSLQFTNGYKKSFRSLSENDKWRVRGFIRNIVNVKEPTLVYQHTVCKECPPDFYLFGLSDDGLGNKGIENQVWINRKEKIIWFLKCKKAVKPKKSGK